MTTTAEQAPARTWQYSAHDRTGQLVKGRVEAPDRDAAVQRILRQGYVPVTVTEAGSGLNREIHLGLGRSVSLKELAVMARQFATMINSGLALVRALGILGEQSSNQALRAALADVRKVVEGGQSLSEGLARHPKIFPELMVNMVRAGEVGGFLDQVLLQIATNFESEVKLRGKIKSAMTYPVVVFVIAVLAVVGMLIFIVPVFARMFDTLGGTLPAPTRVLVWMSHALTTAVPVLIVASIVGVVVWRRVKRRDGVREVVDPLKLKVPIFGALFRKVAISRFTRNLGTMLAAGVPLLQALDVVGDAAGNVVIRAAARDVALGVRAGAPLAVPLAQHKVFPPMVVQMMAVGEDTGSLDAMLGKISEFYDQEVDATAEALTSLIEPLMIAVLGGIIGSMIIALYLPVFGVFNLIK